MLVLGPTVTPPIIVALGATSADGSTLGLFEPNAYNGGPVDVSAEGENAVALGVDVEPRGERLKARRERHVGLKFDDETSSLPSN